MTVFTSSLHQSSLPGPDTHLIHSSVRPRWTTHRALTLPGATAGVDDAHDHAFPQISGNRIVWSGSEGTAYQIFRAKLVTTPRITSTPSGSTLTYTRKNGVAYHALSMTLRDTDGTLIGGARAYLQTSVNGTTGWMNSYAFVTNGGGRASKGLSWNKPRTLYYRWYVPASAEYNRAYSARQRVTVR